MKTLQFEGIMKALTSISHIGNTFGINAKLRREKIIQEDGTVEEVPIISGNSLRGILRDRGMLHLVRCLGYGVNEETGKVLGMPLPSFYFLFSGGALSSKAGRGLDIDKAREWRSKIPLVAIFGGAMGNQIMPGKLRVGKAIPICREANYILERKEYQSDVSIWDMCQEEAYTRRDDAKNENLLPLISKPPLAQIASPQGELFERPKKKKAKKETGQKQQMRYYVETLAAGTRLYWDIALDDVTDLEFEAFCLALAEFARAPYIGGKSGVGLGKVSIKFDNWIEINPHISRNGKSVGFPLGNLYKQHLEQHGDDIREMLNEFK